MRGLVRGKWKKEKRRASGLTSQEVELLKYGGDCITECLVRVLTGCMEVGTVP